LRTRHLSSAMLEPDR